MSDVEELTLDAAVASATATQTKIPVHISYEIIRLFSEGLYQSPQKAIEELVSNSYDAGASAVHVLLPRAGDGGEESLPPLWVIDDGSGMDEAGFGQLWRVADSAKADQVTEENERAPIGQFGIGKLAAYVLASRLTHISSVNGVIRTTSMNFRELEGRHQYEPQQGDFDLQLYEMSVDQAKVALADIEERDPKAWKLMFGDDAAPTWTAAALSDFKQLYEKLSAPRLNWVLSTGLPLHSTFKVFVDGKRIRSSKVNLKEIRTYSVGGDDDSVAKALGLTTTATGVVIPGIDGEISGSAVIYEKRLTQGKSDQYDRSHGFFVTVRERVVNLEDELFGIDALNHAAWSRFSMMVAADGLRSHLLSSREGVRESVPVDKLRKYLHGVFNACRRAYEEWADKSLQGLDLQKLLEDAPSLFVTEPLISGVREVLATNTESYYVSRPDLPEDTDLEEWLVAFSEAATKNPIAAVQFEKTGRYDRALRFVPDTRTMILNTEHPFVEKLISVSRKGSRGAATLFGSSELLLDVLLQESGVATARRIDLFDDRDRLLRLLAGEAPSTASEVLRLLAVANRDELALERAVGAAFQGLGFEYERRGGNEGGADGVLDARLGRGTDALADYRIVYDAKQTTQPAVPADKISPSSLEAFRKKEQADFAFFLAIEYAAQDDLDGKLNQMVVDVTTGDKKQPITMLRIDDLRRIVELHYRFGITLTRLRSLFEEAHTVPQVKAWVDDLERELTELEPRVPLKRLLMRLEERKKDPRARPNVNSVRVLDATLNNYSPEQLAATLKAVEEIVGKRWLEIDVDSGDVILHHTASQVAAEVERLLDDLFGVDAIALDEEDDAEPQDGLE